MPKNRDAANPGLLDNRHQVVRDRPVLVDLQKVGALPELGDAELRPAHGWNWFEDSEGVAVEIGRRLRGREDHLVPDLAAVAAPTPWNLESPHPPALSDAARGCSGAVEKLE
jgi:hypothetical protein